MRAPRNHARTNDIKTIVLILVLGSSSITLPPESAPDAYYDTYPDRKSVFFSSYQFCWRGTPDIKSFRVVSQFEYAALENPRTRLSNSAGNAILLGQGGVISADVEAPMVPMGVGASLNKVTAVQ